MNLSDYIVKVSLPEQLLLDCIVDSRDFNSYVPLNPNKNLLLRLSTKTTGPQRIKYVNPNITASLTSILGVVPEMCLYLVNQPHFITLPHVDEYANSYRKSALTWVIQPLPPSLAAPTLFYDKDNQVINSYTYDSNGFILDTRLRHGMINNNYYRILLQFMLDIEPAELKTKIHANLSIT